MPLRLKQILGCAGKQLFNSLLYRGNGFPAIAVIPRTSITTKTRGMNKYLLICLYLFFFLYACTTNTARRDLPAQTQGYMPVYAPPEIARAVAAMPPRATVNGGKIFTTGQLLFQVEKDSGIHVITYADPAHPEKLGFIRSALCKELSVRNGFIYTNNMSDLVVIDISNLNDIREAGRVANVFPDLALQYPPKTNPGETIYFECPDPAKGMVIGWELKTIKNPKCWR